MPNNTLDIEIDEDLFLPCYRHLQSDTSDIRFLWGGRDSGKSQDIAQRKIVECLQADYFREILIKKTGNSIKDSQWQTIKDICTDWGVDHLFTFTTHPLEITCHVNGNKFIARGCDDVGKLKSIRNPTGAWVEEGNQLSEDDLVVLLTTMRNDKGDVQIDISLNPEAEDVEFEEFYLYKNFFKKWCEQGIYTFKDKFEMKLPSNQMATLTYSATHTTYKDNPHVTPQRIAFHESLEKTNPYYYTVFTLGMWGLRPSGQNPFATAYNEAIHESEEVQRNHHKQLFISLDFNLNPFAVTFSHIWQDSLGMHLHTFDEAEIGIGSIPAMIELIKGRYGDQLHNCLMTGDSGGNKGDLSQSDQISWFEQLRRGLNLRSKQVIVPGVPFHETSRSDCNYLLHHSGIPASKIDVKINPTNCPGLCRDLKNVQCDAFGHIIKRNRKDASQRADFLDCFVGETIVETRTGPQRIDSIKVGDHALTPHGYRLVVDKWSSFAEVYEFTTSDGVKFQCTKDHKFYVDNVGWLEVFSIFESNYSICSLLSYTTEESIENTKNNHTSIHPMQKEYTQGPFTDKCGMIQMEKFQKDTKCITSTMIQETIESKTFALSKGLLTSKCTWLKESKKTQRNSSGWQHLAGSRRLSGTKAEKAGSGTGKTLRTVILDIGPMDKEAAMFVRKNLQPTTHCKDSVPTTASLHGGGHQELTTKQGNVGIAKNTMLSTNIAALFFAQEIVQDHTESKIISCEKVGLRKVWDITVHDSHCFYANKILVHNCHRYTVNTFLKKFILQHQKLNR